EDELTTPVAVVVVLTGRVRVTRSVGAPRDRRRPRREGGVETEPIVLATLAAGEVYVPDATVLRSAEFRLVATSPDGPEGLLLAAPFLVQVAMASFSLSRSVRLFESSAAPILRIPSEDRPALRLHLIWMCETEDLHAPLEALAQLLAASIARDFEEPSATLNLDEMSLAVWRGDRYYQVRLTLTDKADETAIIRAILAALDAVLDAPFYHVFVVRPSRANTLPMAFTPLTFHRIVYVTTTVPTRIPGELERRLKPEARNRSSPSDPYFSSFIPSIVPTTPRPSSSPTSRLSAVRAACLRLIGDFFGCPGGFQVQALPIDQEGNTTDARAGSRLVRDACRVRIDLAHLAAMWEDWKAQAPPTPFPVFAAFAAYEATVSHWARAVTSRLVGLALSGGGASSYRMVPLIDRLRQLAVPIDVLSGVSG